MTECKKKALQSFIKKNELAFESQIMKDLIFDKTYNEFDCGILSGMIDGKIEALNELAKINNFNPKVSDYEFKKALSVVESYKIQLSEKNALLDKAKGLPTITIKDLDININDIPMSVRLYNSLVRHRREINIPKEISQIKLKHFASISVKKFLSMKNVGANTLRELERVCKDAGIKLQD